MAVTATRQPAPSQRGYRPYGAALTIMNYRGKEAILSGPAGTGKSRACMEKLYLCALNYPRMRGLMIRKTRESFSESGLVTWEEKVLPEGSGLAQGVKRNMRQSYRLPNGSEIIVGGIDKPGKIMSTEYDIIYIQEAIELTETDYESLTTRLRNGVMPYQQIIGDTNPDAPHHWLKQRAATGKLTLIESRHEDNPRLWDGLKEQWTAEGRNYIDTLDGLTGTRLDRLRYGRWVAAEGIVYEEYDPAIHLVDRFDIPEDWPRYWLVDFGFVNPFVWQAWAEDDDGNLYRYKEIYQTGLLVEDACPLIKEATENEPWPVAVITDHDAEDRATLERHLGVTTTAAFKDKSPGIQQVKSRLKVSGNGRPRLRLLRDSLVRKDPALVKAKKPTCTEEEIVGYIWDTSQGRRQGEEPVKKDDHGCDLLRYLVAEVDGIEEAKEFVGAALPRIAAGGAGWNRR